LDSGERATRVRRREDGTIIGAPVCPVQRKTRKVTHRKK